MWRRKQNSSCARQEQEQYNLLRGGHPAR
uniref:Uncharacterized protein n=1 Tax=Anguilla anguilla TaxID=7936 RepID=A0A0E9UX31_ANGAN